MSYDIYIKIDTGGADMATVEKWEGLTYNLGPMLNAAFNASFEDKKTTWKDLLNGKTCLPARLPIATALASMLNHPETFKINPANGWGDYKGCVQFMEWLLEQAVKHPKATIVIN